VLPATQVIDTIKRSSDGRTVGGTEDRTQLFAAQTPQGFRYRPILAAHRRVQALTDGYTDDTAIAEWAGIDVALSEGSFDNIKITLPGDFARAEQILGARGMETRVGSGMDIHRFVAGDTVMLGGVAIPHSARLEGHSDADAVLHVLTDALLGALAEGDIGTHFPPGDATWQGAASATFLGFAAKRVAARAGRIVGLDVTVVAEQPKIGPHVMAMRQSIATIAGIDVSRVSVKATTSERMGFVGRREGLMTFATATIEVPGG
jgi:2-C-methyl-D-erythritol 4-phosphate cytidylyltransferase/2-C-methyl-D-erythritol 2,4-cyclodiphosphate synthase